MRLSRRQVYFFSVGVYLAILAWVVLSYFSEGHAGVTVCPFKLVTTLPCPACGTTRGLTAILHGEILQGLWTNPNSLIPLVLLFAFPMLLLWDALDRRHYWLHRAYERYMSLWDKRWVLYAFLGLEAIVWIHNIHIGN